MSSAAPQPGELHAGATYRQVVEGNRLDAVKNYDPDELAQRFLAAATSGEHRAPGCGLASAYRWSLTDRDGMNSTFE